MGYDDWIANLKNDLRQSTDDARRAEEIRLLEDRAIHANLPRFWQLTIETVKAKAQQLRAESILELNVDVQAERITIRRSAAPLALLSAWPNMDGHIVEVTKAADVDSIGNPERPIRETIHIGVLAGNSLEFRCAGRRCVTPNELAEHLLKWVIEGWMLEG